ncbi:MAG: hypothetical protein AB2809_20255 [Candidatus Thiodiazotropha sp.]
MHRLSRKLFAVLLSLLLGLIPLQGAMGGFISPLKQKGGEHQYQIEAHHEAGMIMMNDHAAELNCGQHSTDAGYDGNSCSFGHCVSCLLALLPDFFFPTLHTAVSIVIQTDSDLLNQTVSSLFRPPRA